LPNFTSGNLYRVWFSLLVHHLYPKAIADYHFKTADSHFKTADSHFKTADYHFIHV